jgi:hypothetical protein
VGVKLARITALVVVACGFVGTVLSGTTVTGSHGAPQWGALAPTLSGGASSLDELLKDFVDALADNDGRRLEALHVTEDEYRQVILPGSVEPGQPPQTISEEGGDYFWDLLSTKSAYHRQGILRQYGGRRYEIVDASWRKGIRDWAGYRAYQRLELTLRDEEGKELVLETGSVAEVRGRFKFISFIRD